MPKRSTSRNPGPPNERIEAAAEQRAQDISEEQDRRLTVLAYARADAWAQSPAGTQYGSIVIPTMQASTEKSK